MQCHQNIDWLCACKLSQVRKSCTPKCEWMQVTAVAITMTSVRSIPSKFKTFIGRQPWQHVTESLKNLPFLFEFYPATKTFVCRRCRQNSGLVAGDLTREEGDSPARNIKLTQTAIWTTKSLMTNWPYACCLHKLTVGSLLNTLTLLESAFHSPWQQKTATHPYPQPNLSTNIPHCAPPTSIHRFAPRRSHYWRLTNPSIKG